MPSRFTTTTKKTGASRFTTSNVSDLKTSTGLTSLAQKGGFGQQAEEILNPPQRLSVFQRLGAGLSALETGEAVATGLEKGVLAGAGAYVKGVGKGLASAVTGVDYGQTEKRTYRDLVEKAGIENKVAKFGIGLLGDILLDPSTYFGGAIAKGLTKGVKVTGGTALKGIGKVAPDIEKGLRLAGTGVKEAAGKAFVFGYGTSKGLSNEALEITGKIAKAKEGIVASNIKRLGTNTLSPSKQEELVGKLLLGKRAEFAGQSAEEAIKVAQSTDPIVQKTIAEQATRSQKFAKSAGIDDPYTIYFPGLAKDKITKFVEGTKTLKIGSEGYKKEFKNILKDEELVRNPAEAFARREFEIAKDSIVRSELGSIVTRYGKKLTDFKNVDEALKAGYRVIKEKGVFGKEVGYLKEVDKKFLDNMISPEFSTIDAIAKATGFDAVTSLFKRSVTGLFAPFHVRNYVSGNIQNFEVLGVKALSPKNLALGKRMAYHL